MASQNYNFPNHCKGDTFQGVEFTLNRNAAPIDLTGASLRMMLRLDKTVSPPALTLSSPSGGLTITDAVNGVFTVDKQIISIDAGDYFYDIELTESNGDINTYIAGKWVILQDTTYS
jgi:hypothetical protein